MGAGLIAWLIGKISGKLALPIMGVLLVTNIVSGVGLAITRNTLADRTRDLAAEQKVHAADIATWKAGAVLALERDRAHAADVKTKQDAITREKQHELQDQLASAHSAAARIVREYAQAHNSRGSAANLPQAADTAGSPDSTTPGAFLSAADVDACAVAHTVAEGWQAWWAKEYPVMLQASGQGGTGGAVDVDRDPVAAMVGRGPTAQSVAPVEKSRVPVDLLAAVQPVTVAALPTPIVTGSADGEQNQNADGSGKNGPTDHKNFLP